MVYSSTRRRWSGFIGAIALMTATGTLVHAKPLQIEAVMSPKEQIRLNFQDGSKHFVLFIKREGVAHGDAPLDGARVTENGMHDIVPGQWGDPRGYLTLGAKDGALLYIKWRVRAIFIPGPTGKPSLLDNGYWEVVGATGSLAGSKGAGTLHIKAAGPKDRRFILTGELTR